MAHLISELDELFKKVDELEKKKRELLIYYETLCFDCNEKDFEMFELNKHLEIILSQIKNLKYEEKRNFDLRKSLEQDVVINQGVTMRLKLNLNNLLSDIQTNKSVVENDENYFDKEINKWKDYFNFEDSEF